VSHTNTD